MLLETNIVTTVLLFVAWGVFALALIYFVLGGILAYLLLHPKKRTDEYLIEYESEQKGLDKTRVDIPFENITLVSDNPEKYSIRAKYYALEGSQKTVVSVHGYNSSTISQLKYLHIWKELGYNVLLPDNTTSGDSTGSCISMGYLEKQDILKWLDYLKERDPNQSFALFGESMGGATVIGAAALYPEKLLWTGVYCTYANLSNLAKFKLKQKKLPQCLRMVMPAVYVGAYLLYGVRLWQVNSLKDINLIPNPILIMHSKGDRLIDVENARLLHEQRPDATYFEYEASPHCRSWSYYPELFESNIKDFVRNAEQKSLPKQQAKEVTEKETAEVQDIVAATSDAAPVKTPKKSTKKAETKGE